MVRGLTPSRSAASSIDAGTGASRGFVRAFRQTAAASPRRLRTVGNLLGLKRTAPRGVGLGGAASRGLVRARQAGFTTSKLSGPRQGQFVVLGVARQASLPHSRLRRT